jgi:hypothetical protein
MSRGRGSAAVTRAEVMRVARGLYDTGKNRVTSFTRFVGMPATRVHVVQVDSRVVASGGEWWEVYANLRANYGVPREVAR